MQPKVQRYGFRPAGSHRGSLLLALAVTLLAAAGTRTPARAAELDRELLRQAPQVMQYLRDKGYHNVGVLKFRARKGSEPASDSVGTLNLDLAQHLEMALILANDRRHPVGIVHDASAVAARLQGANHLTREGRQALFQGQYPLAWGNQEVTPDAFLTGVAQFSADLKELNVGIVAFDRGNANLEKVVQFTASTDVVALADAGESFLLRGAFDGGKVEPVQTAARVRNETEKHPLANEAAPVELEVRYDGRKVPLEIHDGRALIVEPQEGQKISFVLRRKPGDRGRYGVVLKVNGESTLHRERLPDVQCLKWILDPGDPPITIQGFQLSDNKAEEFRVLSREASKAREMYYGADVGTITLTVFGEKKRGPERPAALPSDEDEDLAVLQRGVFPRDRPRNLDALQEQLREDATRGVIEGGEKFESSVQHVPFEPAATPILAATITYYRP